MDANQVMAAKQLAAQQKGPKRVKIVEEVHVKLDIFFIKTLK